jgi:GT2 family glycosyltransferase
MTPSLSVIVPAHRAPAQLERCIAALRASDLPREKLELIVVDDGSDDQRTASVAQSADRAVTLSAPAGGPARARNAGADVANAPVLAFVDADVLVHADALRILLGAFDDPEVSAAIGSYDDAPEAQTVVSQYRNLLHHRVHQMSAGPVDSFWAGLGAIRADAFRAAGMFDEQRYTMPEMEDVELGYRLRDAGMRIESVPAAQGKHLKRWTLGSMLRSDFNRRGIPWARLLYERGWLLSPRGLSLGASERAGAILAASAALALAVALIAWSRPAALVAGVLLLAFVLVNARFFSWLASVRGIGTAVAAVPLHFTYNIVAVSALAAGAAAAVLSPTAPARYTRRR